MIGIENCVALKILGKILQNKNLSVFPFCPDFYFYLLKDLQEMQIKRLSLLWLFFRLVRF